MTGIAIGRWAPRFGTAAALLLSVCWGLVHPAHAQPPSREVCDKLMSDTLEEIRIASPRVSNAIKVLQDSHCEGSRAACTQAAEYLRVQTAANQPDKVANVRLAQRAQSCIP